MLSRLLSMSSLLLLLCTSHCNFSTASEAKVQNVTTTTATSSTASPSSTSTTTKHQNDDGQNKTKTNLPFNVTMETGEENKKENENQAVKSAPSRSETSKATTLRRIKREKEGSSTIGWGLQRPATHDEVKSAKGGSVGAAQFFDRRRRRRSASPDLDLDSDSDIDFDPDLDSDSDSDLSKFTLDGLESPSSRIKLPTITGVVQHVQQAFKKVNKIKCAQNILPFRETPWITQIQGRFSFIDRDFRASLQFLRSRAVQSSPTLLRQLVVRASGVSCADVCTRGNIYGLIGICTIDYCICEGQQNFEHEQRQCPGSRIFDPMRLACTDPQKSVLCSDENKDQAFGVPIQSASSSAFASASSSSSSGFSFI